MIQYTLQFYLILKAAIFWILITVVNSFYARSSHIIVWGQSIWFQRSIWKIILWMTWSFIYVFLIFITSGLWKQNKSWSSTSINHEKSFSWKRKSFRVIKKDIYNKHSLSLRFDISASIISRVFYSGFYRVLFYINSCNNEQSPASL